MEARATLFAVKHMARSSSSFGKKHLIFSDSMTAVASISRGRAHARGLRRVVQQISALCLCLRISIHTRWCASEWNPSRRPFTYKYTATEPVFDFHEDGVAQSVASGVERHRGSHLETIQGEGESSNRANAFSADKALFDGCPRNRVQRRFQTHLGHPQVISANEKIKGESKQSSDGPNNIAAGSSQACDQAEVSQTLGRVLFVEQFEQMEDKHKRGGGSCFDHVPGRGLSRWGGSQSGSIHCGSTDFYEARTEKPFNAEAATDKPKSSGVAQLDASPKPSSHSLGGDMLGGSLGVQDEVEANGGGFSGGVLYVSEAIRTLPDQGERRCAPQPKVKTQTSEIGDNPAQLRGRVPSKTHEFDETVELDLEHQQFLVGMVRTIIREGKLTGEHLLFNLEAAQIRTFLQTARDRLDITGIGPLHPYRLRHGGASVDYWEKHRSIVEIQKRGRWRATASVRRYEKGGWLSQPLNSLPSHTQELATWTSENIEQAFYNQRLLTNIP